MKRFIQASVTGIIILCLSCGSFSSGRNRFTVNHTHDDILYIERILDTAKKENWRLLPVQEIAVKTGVILLGKPYRGCTLEVIPEQLVVNLREFDCVTFVETCIAAALTIKSMDPSFETYCRHLMLIRYEKGIINGYASRLHYTSHWIIDNSKKGLLAEITCSICGVPWNGTINSMTRRRDKIPQMRDGSVFSRILETENMLNSLDYCYIPKQEIDKCGGKIRSGDILALTVNSDGDDVGHIGFAYADNGRIMFMHASSENRRVEITDCTLRDYLSARKRFTGIRVVRLN